MASADESDRIGALEASLEVLLAKQEIRDRMFYYCRGVDRSDADLIGLAYHPDAVDEHGPVTFEGEDIGRQIADYASKTDTVMHMVGNMLIEVDGTRASSEAYFLLTAEMVVDGSEVFVSRGGRYVDEWEQRGGEWRIARRTVLDDWDRMGPIAERWPARDQFNRGLRSSHDESYNRLGRAFRGRHGG